MNTSGYEYKYSASRDKPCLYASIYAVMTEGLLGVLQLRSHTDLNNWAEYLNGFQNPKDGLYYDPNLKCPAYEHIGCWNEGWGKHHLISHLIIALARLGHLPKYPLTYLEKYYEPDYLINWMNGFDFSGNVWTSSNFFMNLYTVLEYVRDYMGESKADNAIKVITEWLIKNQDPQSGMWHHRPFHQLNNQEKLNIIRSAYHFYPLFEYEGIPIPHCDKIIETILPLQNSWGGWTLEGCNSGACEDIDAVEPLIRCALQSQVKDLRILEKIRRSLIWQFSSRNKDKGFSFYVRAQQNYGDHPLTTSIRDESSMFATWFRTLCIAYEVKYLGIPNDFNIGRFPGYEISL